MPRQKRFTPVSHDFNRDTEVIQLRKEFGDWLALAWIEMLGEGDRNDGRVKGTIEQVAANLAPISLQKYHKPAADLAQKALRFMSECGWIDINLDHIQIVNHLKYHRTTVPKQEPSEPDLTRPNHPKEDTLVDETFSVRDLVDSWNDVFKNRLPSVEWPLSASRHRKATARLKEHRTLEFWQQVFDKIGESRFLLGQGNGTWKCTLDFLINNDTNCVKIFEGSYNSGSQTNQQRRFGQ